MGGPQRLVGRYGDDERAARTRDPPQLAQRAPVVRGVLDDVEAGDEVERRIGEGHALDCAAARRMAAEARRGHGAGVGVDPDHHPASAQVVEHASRSAARIEDPGVRGQLHAIELGMQHAPSAPVPPMALVAGEDGVDLAAVHHALAAPVDRR